jgi:hypothetical protein
VSEEHLYVRAEASRSAKNGRQAAAEYQKILDHRGVVLYEPIGALAHLGLARAYALQGETAKARVAIRIFSPHGKTPTRIFPSSLQQSLSTRN